MTDPASQRRFTLYAWGLLVYNLPVILWGAVVRATGSGAGCGNHWPTCDGSALPPTGNTHELIEYAHRLSSGMVIPLAGLLLWWALRAFPPRHPARRGAALVVFFSLSEAILGAGLVLFKLVAHDASVYRAVAISAHLANTFCLLAAITLTAWWGTNPRPVRISGQGIVGRALIAGIVLALLLGMSGAVTALGDTLFPPHMSEIGRSVPATAHFLKHVRVYHPYLAVSVGLYLVAIGALASRLRPTDAVRNLAYGLGLLFVAQIGIGFMNLLLLAPIWSQLLHLLLADVVWIVLVLLTASSCAEGAPRAVVSFGRRPAAAASTTGASIEGMP